MSKAAKKRYLIAFGIAIVLFFGTSFIQIHRDQAFTCGNFDHVSDPSVPNEQTKYRMEYGLPFAFVKRSVSDSECVIKGQDYSKASGDVGYGASEVVREIYNKHEVSYFNFFADIYIWLTVAYFVVKIVSKHRGNR